VFVTEKQKALSKGEAGAYSYRASNVALKPHQQILDLIEMLA
jgi:hypothetical protein